MNIYNDERIVLTLDAGGTNFVFTALQKGKSITEEIRKDANADNLALCINTMKEGFRELMGKLDEKPAAISFAFFNTVPADAIPGFSSYIFCFHLDLLEN